MSEPQRASHSSESLLNTKLMPPRPHAGLILRPALLSRLDEALHRKLTLVSAPAGFGKTTLVGSWLSDRNPPAAWVTLDENDNDPVRFWTYVVSALRTFDTGLGKSALAALSSSQPPAFPSVLTPLINELSALPGPYVLALEDYHVITSGEIQSTLSFLLQHAPPSLHLILIARGEPGDLPVATLRARDELVEIDAESLRFTRTETESFLRQELGAELGESAVAKLQEQTEGWAAGLRLLLFSLRGTGEQVDLENRLSDFSGGHHYVTDYLIDEVFNGQPEAIRNFLLQTCFLDRLTGSLCDALTSSTDGAVTLDTFERENLFLVQLGSSAGRNWYRYNPLFAESIQYLARQHLGEAGIASIFEKASLWYEEQQLYEDAIETALKSGSLERALSLMEKFIELHYVGEMYTLGRWLEDVPTELVLKHPEICLTYAQVILYSSDRYAPATAARIQPYLAAAEEAWRAAGDLAKVGQVSALRGTILLWQGDLPQAFRSVHESLEELPEHDAFWRGISLLNLGQEGLLTGRVLSTQDVILEAQALLGASQNVYGLLAAQEMLSETFYLGGELDQAAEINRQILTDAVGEESMLDDQGSAHLNLARIAYERNELEAAQQEATQASELAQRRANELLLVQAKILSALVQAAGGELAAGRESLRSLQARVKTPSASRELQDAQALLAVRADDLSALTGWQTGLDDDHRTVFRAAAERHAFILARLRIAEGKPEAARQVLEGWQSEASGNGRVRSQVEVSCLEALAWFADGNQPRAFEILAHALAIGHARGFRRIFLDEGAPMAATLAALAPSLSDRSLSLYVTTLLQSFDPNSLPAQKGNDLIEPLSQQELRVLRLLVAGMSNSEIARELVVSTNTVKTHVKSIYRKLNVKSRSEAREAARELRLS